MAHCYDVLALGDYFADLIFTGMDQLPELGKEVFSTGFEMVPGGAYNSVLAMHRLGIKVGWAADFGDDDFSRFAVERARAEGLDDRLFVHHSRPLRRITVAASYPKDRAFLTYVDREPSLPAAARALATASARVVFVAGVYYGWLLDAGLLAIRSKRMKLVMDGNSGDEVTLRVPAVGRALAAVDVFLPNAPEARRIAGEADAEQALRVLSALGPIVVVKDGPNGALALVGDRILREPAIPVTPIDTTGAGDCFNAGFLSAWLDGRPLAECMRRGNIVGGLSTTARGGTGRAVTLADVTEWDRDARSVL